MLAQGWDAEYMFLRMRRLEKGRKQVGSYSFQIFHQTQGCPREGQCAPGTENPTDFPPRLAPQVRAEWKMLLGESILKADAGL